LDLAGGTALIIRRLIVPLTVAAVTACASQACAQGAFPAPLPGQTVQPNDPAFPPVPGQTVRRNDPAFPPAPGQTVQRNDPAFPPVNGANPTTSVGAAPAPASFPVNGVAPIVGAGLGPPSAPTQAGPSAACMDGFLPLRQEAEKRGKLIKAASDRHASPQEACKLIKNYSQAEAKMIQYVESHMVKCGIPAEVSTQLKAGHKNTEITETKVCNVAEQRQAGPAGPSLSEVLGSAAALPEASPVKKGGSTFDTLNGNVLTR
jgi:hypothetical protein